MTDLDRNENETIELNVNIKLNEIKICHVEPDFDGTKYLGGIIVDFYNNGKHINKRKQKGMNILYSIKFTNVFNYGLQLRLCRLVVCNLIRPVVAFGSQFFNYSVDEIDTVNKFQNLSLRTVLQLTKQASTAFMRILIGVCDMEHWIDYLNLCNYYRTIIIIKNSMASICLINSMEYLNEKFNININDVKNLNVNDILNDNTNVVAKEFLHLLNKYKLIYYWNPDNLADFKTAKMWKKFIFNNVCGNAWKNDWNKLKIDLKTKKFFRLNSKYFKNKKYYSLNDTLDFISGMDESVGIRWLFLIWSGHTPLDYTTTVSTQSLVERKSESIFRRKRSWKSKNVERMKKCELNNGGIVRHKNFKSNIKTNNQNDKNESKYCNKLFNLSNGDFVAIEKKIQIKKYQFCLWCKHEWKDPFKHIFINCSKLSKWREQYDIIAGVNKNFVLERKVLINTVKFLNEVFKHQSL